MKNIRMVLRLKKQILQLVFSVASIAVLAVGCISTPPAGSGHQVATPISTVAIPLTAATQPPVPTSVPATDTAVPPTATLAPSPTMVPATATQAQPTMVMASPTPMVMPLPSTPQPTNQAASIPMTGSQQVSIANFAFNPGSLTIAVGTKVTWTNNDNIAHTVTADKGAFNSGLLNPGASFSFVFNQPGSYSYHCQIHPMMTGTIIVSNTMSMPPVPTSPPASFVPNVVAIPVNPPASRTNANSVMAVTIQNFTFSPQTLTIKAGTKVQWINQDGTAHTVTANSGTFDSNVLQPGSHFAVTFSQPGTYTYHCKIHPNMVGTIFVTGKSNTVPSVPQSGGGAPSPSSPSYPSGGSYPMYPGGYH